VAITKQKHKMRNSFYFYIKVTSEQVEYTKKLVEHSMKNHTIPNIWDGTNKEKDTVDLRFTGTLGEVVFADVYGLDRPTRSFGALDGQDLGKDFQIEIEGEIRNFDIKSMRRNNNTFYSDYVLNIPSSQLNKHNSLTDYYFHINIHPKTGVDEDFVASFVGYVSKDEIKNGTVGKFYSAGTWRTRGNGTKFKFNEDTYEVDLADLTSPLLNDKIKKMEGYGTKQIK
jgi:hypothetical protein